MMMIREVVLLQKRESEEVHSWRDRGAVESMVEAGGVASKLSSATLFVSITWAKEG